MKIYLAACFEQQAEVRDKADQLARLGIKVTSQWRFEDGTLPPEPNYLDERACIDLEDIRSADLFVVLTNQTSKRGGKHFETGYAYALGKPVIIVGPRENIFHSLKKGMAVHDLWDDAVSELLDILDIIRAVEAS